MAGEISINIGKDANATSSHGFVGRGFVGNEDVDALVLFVGGEDLFFVVAPLGVDFPGVEVWRILA